MKKVSRERRKWNQLVDRYKQGDGWIETVYDWEFDAVREIQKPWGWNPFGLPKWDDEELAEAIEKLEEWIDRDDHDNPNWCRSIGLLTSIGIVYE